MLFSHSFLNECRAKYISLHCCFVSSVYPVCWIKYTGWPEIWNFLHKGFIFKSVVSNMKKINWKMTYAGILTKKRNTRIICSTYGLSLVDMCFKFTFRNASNYLLLFVKLVRNETKWSGKETRIETKWNEMKWNKPYVKFFVSLFVSTRNYHNKSNSCCLVRHKRFIPLMVSLWNV